MKFDQDLRLNLRYDFGKMNSTLGSVVPLAMFSSESGPGAAVSGMSHEINSGYSCYITAALTTQNSKKRLLKHNGMAMEFLKASLL